jgi:F-type H+-transporting ATPase subunit epsilon
MKITVLTPDIKIFEGPVKSVKVPGTMGKFQILKNHAPIVSSLEAGKVEIITSSGTFYFFNEETGVIDEGIEPGKKITYEITGGFIEVLKNNISLLVQGISENNSK